jgi:glutaminase
VADLTSLTSSQLQGWIIQALPLAEQGELPSYIPLLANANRYLVAVSIRSLTAPMIALGATDHAFPLMSVVKPFVLLFLLEQFGQEQVFARVGMEPSAQAFNSLAQLEADQGWPRNPMINSGAIALADFLPGNTPLERCQHIQQWLNHQAGSEFVLDQAMLSAVESTPNPNNQAIAARLQSAGRINATSALATYNRICCLTGRITDLAALGLLLAQPTSDINNTHRQIVNSLMLTCGLYEQSEYFASRIGLPTKSGVSGALLSVVPEQGAIALYSPALDATGNSIVGLSILEQIALTIKSSSVS